MVLRDSCFTGSSRSLRDYQPDKDCKMVDRHGFAPCSSACKAGDLLNDRAARFGEIGCGGRIRTGDTRRMKPLPYHLATPLFIRKKLARRPGAAPDRQGFGGPAAQADARRVVNFEKMVRPVGLAPAFPDWKSGILLLDDDRIVIK
jgi:hypothetical protein